MCTIPVASSNIVVVTIFRGKRNRHFLILEAGRCMLATVDLMYSDNMESSSFEEEVEIGIIGIRKGLKNLII